MTDARSVYAWLLVAPARHKVQLVSMAKRHDEWRPAIRQALQWAVEAKANAMNQLNDTKG